MSTKTRTYTELMRQSTLEDRFRYLALRAEVARETFGFDRYLNQKFYTSTQWRSLRNHVIVRDNGCDLGVEGYDIRTRLYIHHLNPMTVQDVIADDGKILDPEFLITTTLRTHNAIHYGDENLLPKTFVDRRVGDTKLW
jgi:hypothetical protein